MATLDLFKLFGKVIVLLYFTLSQNMSAWPAIVAMPSLMLVFGACRTQALIDANMAAGKCEGDLASFCAETIMKYPLIADYFQRPHVNDLFREKCSDCRTVKIDESIVVLNNEYFPMYL